MRPSTETRNGKLTSRVAGLSWRSLQRLSRQEVDVHTSYKLDSGVLHRVEWVKRERKKRQNREVHIMVRPPSALGSWVPERMTRVRCRVINT